MAIDTSIYGNLLQAPRSALDYQNAYAAQDDARMARQMNALQLQETQAKMQDAARARSEDQAFRNYLAGGADLSTPEGQRGLYAVAPKLAPGIIKGQLELGEVQARTGKENATRVKTEGETLDAGLARYRTALGDVQNPAQAIEWLKAQYADPIVGPYIGKIGGSIMQAAQRIPQDPQAFMEWRNQAALGLQKHLEQQRQAGNDAATNANRDLIPDGKGGWMVNQPLVNAKKAIAAAGASVTLGTPLAAQLNGETVFVQPANRPGAAPTVLRIPGPNGGPVTPPPDKKDTAAETARVRDANDALALIADARKIIPAATGSSIGAAVDSTAGAFGVSTAGAQAAAQLKALEGMLTSKMPKMSGPQSDKDVEMYKQMAGKIGDPNIPKETKIAALNVIEQIQRRYAGQQDQAAPAPAAQPKPSAAPAKTQTGATVSNW